MKLFNNQMKWVALASLLLTSLQTKGQIDKTLEKLNLYSLAYPQEKVYLYVDRALYGNGETIWFQAYITLSPLGTFSDLSNTLYVQLINRNNETIIIDKVFIENGVGQGHFELPLELSTGEYQLIAFTNWMRNFDEENYFRKDLEILNEAVPAENQFTNTEQLVDVQFLPESGSLIANAPSKIAFKALLPSGLPKEVNGTIYNSQNEPISRFSSTHDGMGIAYLTARENE